MMRHAEACPQRIGRIGYINCAPVYGAIDRGIVALPPGGELVTGTPAELNDLLVAGELDVSVISAIEYARHAKDLVLLPDLAISCDGPVRSGRPSHCSSCCAGMCGRSSHALRKRAPKRRIWKRSLRCRTRRYW